MRRHDRPLRPQHHHRRSDPAGCIADAGDAAGCGTTQQGLSGAGSVAVSPDGRSVYVASAFDHAIARFDRVPGPLPAPDYGALTPADCIADVGDAAGCGTTQQGLNGANVGRRQPRRQVGLRRGRLDDAVVRFDRNATTGALTPAGCVADAGDAAGCGTTQQGLDGACSVAVSPDGRSVYVAGTEDDAIVRFDRNTTTGALTPAGCIADAGDPAGCGTTQQGLGGASSVAVSPDGRSVYVASACDNAIVRFDRNTTTGALTPPAASPTSATALGAAPPSRASTAPAPSPSAPTASRSTPRAVDDAIVRFDRNTTTGALTPAGCIADAGSSIGCGTTQQGLNGATSVAVSPDGKSVYVAGCDDAIVRFDRNTTTGALTPAGCIADAGERRRLRHHPAGPQRRLLGRRQPRRQVGLRRGPVDDAMVRFDRNTTTGALTPAGCIADVGTQPAAAPPSRASTVPARSPSALTAGRSMSPPSPRSGRQPRPHPRHLKPQPGPDPGRR